MKLNNPKHEAAAWSLAQGETQAEAARAAGVDRATCGRWLKIPAFSARVDELRIAREQQADSLEDAPADPSDDKFEELVELAWEVVRAAIAGEPGPGGRIPTTAQHTNALKTIELARKLAPKESSSGPSLADLIAQADADRAAR